MSASVHFGISSPSTEPLELDRLVHGRFFAAFERNKSGFSNLASLLSPRTSLADFARLVEAKAAKVIQQSPTGAETGRELAELTEVLDLHLQGKEVRPQKVKIALRGLQAMLGKRGQGNTVMAQINPHAGNLEANATKIMQYIEMAEAINADSIVFPELSLMGYPIHDFIGRHPFIVDENVKWLKAIAKRTGKTRALVGFVEPRKIKPGEKGQGRQFFNSVAVLGDGKILGIVRKSLLPTYGEFNEWRQFEPSPKVGMHSAGSLSNGQWAVGQNSQEGRLTDMHGIKYAISICEDGWNDKDFFAQPLYGNDPVEELVKLGPEVLINSSSSPTRNRKEQLKHNMLAHVAQKYGLPYVYVNQVGAMDENSFEGSSRVYNDRGKIIARAKSFREQFMIVNPKEEVGHVYPLPMGLEKNQKATKKFSPTYDDRDLARTYATIVQCIRDFYKKCGMKKAVLGVSGGLDSTIVATLLADALGPENVIGLTLPSALNPDSSKSDAELHADRVGFNVYSVPIQGSVDAVWRDAQPVLAKIAKDHDIVDPKWDTSEDNVQARIRQIIISAVSNKVRGSMTIATSDKSELYMGYTTIYGDMSGGYAPIADIPKTKVFALGHWMNKHRPVKNAIPKAILKKKPGAELKRDEQGNIVTAESELGPYYFIDEMIWRLENTSQSLTDMMKDTFYYENHHNAEEHLKIYGEPMSNKLKRKWLDNAYKRMMGSVFKWWQAPPMAIVEGGSIAKSDYRQLLTTRVNPWGDTYPAINKKLDNALSLSA